MRRITGVIKAIANIVGIPEILFVAGFSLVFVGLWWLLPASALVVGGLALVVLALLGARKAG